MSSEEQSGVVMTLLRVFAAMLGLHIRHAQKEVGRDVERVCQAEPFAGSWQLARRWCVGCATAHVAVRAARVRGVRYSGCSDERLLHPRKAGAPWARL